MTARLICFICLGLLSFGCSQEQLFLPNGNPVAGKQAFVELECYSCHEVPGEDFPKPSAITPTFVSLGRENSGHSRYYLVESILAPSHSFAEPEAPEGVPTGIHNIQSGSKSRMPVYSDRMKVCQLLDVVAYLETLESGQPVKELAQR